MARGWESKSVEAQIDMAEVQHPRAVRKQTIAPEQLNLIRQKENILLSRTRVMHELESAQNPRYRAVLNKALADLDAKLIAFAVD
ncbi:MAG TPA: hypothetical protein VGF59_03370 [Bryobacteraceae bacterium]|jgi:hypothetical protein